MKDFCVYEDFEEMGDEFRNLLAVCEDFSNIVFRFIADPDVCNLSMADQTKVMEYMGEIDQAIKGHKSTMYAVFNNIMKTIQKTEDLTPFKEEPRKAVHVLNLN